MEMVGFIQYMTGKQEKTGQAKPTFFFNKELLKVKLLLTNHLILTYT